MGRFAQQHPGELTTLIGEAIAKGAKAPEVRRQLLAGTFRGWQGTYNMPLETVRYYGKKEKARRAANALSPLAKGDPSRGIDHLARQLFSEAEIGIEDMRRSKARDPEALKKWGDALKVIGSLLRPEEAEQPKKGKRAKTPSDPLTDTLTAAAKTQHTVPSSHSREDREGAHVGAEPSAEPTQQEPHTAAGLLRGAQDRPSWPPVERAA